MQRRRSVGRCPLVVSLKVSLLLHCSLRISVGTGPPTTLTEDQSRTHWCVSAIVPRLCGMSGAHRTEWTLAKFDRSVSKQSESTATTRTQNVSTNDEATTSEVDREYPVLGHRDAARSAPDPRGCRLRLRMTGSQPFQRGSIWRSKPVLTGRGFETEFTFQISDQSRSCSFVRDVATASELYKSCSVHGADGFAFVLHNDPDGAEALGEGGNGLGYAGMRNAIVVAFDTWYNPDAGDTLQDHIVCVRPLAPGCDAVGNRIPK